MSAPLLEFQQVTLRAGARTLVQELSLRVFPGEVWCLLGSNGAGKTTLLNTVMGLRRPQAGNMRLAGRALEEQPPGDAARLRGFLPQAQHDAFSATVLDSVLLGRHPHLARWQWEDDNDRARAREALGTVGLAGFEARDVLTLSGGERQRVALATVLVQNPPLLLLDEPVSHLDLHQQIAVLDHVSGLAREHGKAVMFTVHDLNLGARYATHALLLSHSAALHGPIGSVMTERNLAQAFGHRVTRVETAGRTLFVPE